MIGFPNVGKSSLINSLKRTRVAAVGNTPGVTRSAQEVHLDKHVTLLDSPGIVFAAAGADSAASALRNYVKARDRACARSLSWRSCEERMRRLHAFVSYKGPMLLFLAPGLLGNAQQLHPTLPTHAALGFWLAFGLKYAV